MPLIQLVADFKNCGDSCEKPLNFGGFEEFQHHSFALVLNLFPLIDGNRAF